jgi:hypothetical protein
LLLLGHLISLLLSENIVFNNLSIFLFFYLLNSLGILLFTQLVVEAILIELLGAKLFSGFVIFLALGLHLLFLHCS